jgi:hypothetical protein
MTVKATGAEVKAFYTAEKFWPKGTIHEDEVITIDGIAFDEGSIDLGTELSDTCIVAITDGYVTNDTYDKDLGSFESYFKKWRKQQNTAFLSVAVPKDKLDAVLAAIKAAGGKVNK